VGTDSEKIFSEAMILLEDSNLYQSMGKGVNPYGGGLASQRIVAVLGEPMKPFILRKED
jgi:UDP-N-acetylglucosamine 2-epimerase (non-hydrolysing)